jgi:hypothetical protein
MHTQIDSIALLLTVVTAASIAVGADVEAHPAGERDFFSTLMRHGLALASPVAAILLARGVRELARPRPLVPPASLPQRMAPRRRRALLRAVPLPPVVPTTEVGNPPAGGQDAGEEAQRVHGSGRDRKELDPPCQPCDDVLVAAGSGL